MGFPLMQYDDPFLLWSIVGDQNLHDMCSAHATEASVYPTCWETTLYSCILIKLNQVTVNFQGCEKTFWDVIYVLPLCIEKENINVYRKGLTPCQCNVAKSITVSVAAKSQWIIEWCLERTTPFYVMQQNWKWIAYWSQSYSLCVCVIKGIRANPASFYINSVL